MEDTSLNDSLHLTLEPFVLPPGGKYPIFIVGILVYLFSVFCNMTVLILIIVEKDFHRPMYFILFSLPLNDFIGISAMLPKVLLDIVTETSMVYYPLCVLQGFLLHMYGGGVLFVLTAMAFDRYIAICNPLRYNTIMTPCTVMIIIVLAWGADFILIGSLFFLQVRLPRCNNSLTNVYCDNPSLLKLTCADTTMNNIFGLCTTAIMQLISISVQVFSYVQILIACLVNRQSDAKSKAINTCVAQLVVFLLFEFTSTFTILSHRFKNISSNLQKITGMLIFLLPPVLNPIVYGMKTKELRNTLIKVMTKQVSSR
ncbi:olfactory receptor 52B2-like [Amia ocellicauda]|uniref:olfactory receptor 52B2-like n=1 Tax=Amia ocellicauda TaxID=2972642 RepID=UPI003463FAFE